MYFNVAYHLVRFLSTPGSLILTSGVKTRESKIISHPALFVPNGSKLPRQENLDWEDPLLLGAGQRGRARVGSERWSQGL